MQTELHFLLIVSQSNIWNCRTQGFLIYCFKEVIKTGGSEGRRSACRYPECRWKDRRTRISEYSYRNFFSGIVQEAGTEICISRKNAGRVCFVEGGVPVGVKGTAGSESIQCLSPAKMIAKMDINITYSIKLIFALDGMI